MENKINRLAKQISGDVNFNETELTDKLFDMIQEKYGVKSEQFALIERIDLDTQYNASNQNFKSFVDVKDIKRLIEITK